MNRDEYRKLSSQIGHRIAELEAFLEQHDSSTGELAGAAQDAEPGAAPDRQITEMKRQELARLRANVRWLDSDNGGCCEQCGCDIPVARLRAVPVTRLCVDCAR